MAYIAAMLDRLPSEIEAEDWEALDLMLTVRAIRSEEEAAAMRA